MKKYKLYTLSNPITNEIRYVGKTIQTLENRLKKHLRAKDKSHRVNWIKSLKNKGLEPRIELICETHNHNICNELEKYYIKKYKNEGYSLVNMTEGGDGSIGFTHTNESKIKISKITKNRMSDPKVREYLSDVAKENWKNYSDKFKENNIINQPNRKCIGQYDKTGELIQTFVSLREIERELGYFRANISPCIKGKFKQAYGYVWKYI